jgi:predicted transposase YdaD
VKPEELRIEPIIKNLESAICKASSRENSFTTEFIEVSVERGETVGLERGRKEGRSNTNK